MKRFNWLSLLGPGLVMAAAGVGAGDIITSSVAGAKFGFVLLWAVIFGALLKYVLNEGLIRWQAASGTTMIEAWYTQIGSWLSYGFLGYLVFWSIFVGGGLLTSMGVVTHAIFKSLSVTQAGVICALIVLGLVFTRSYKIFEGVMKFFVIIMFVGFAYGASRLLPETKVLLSGFFLPIIPSGSMLYILGLMGGIGASLTIMCYGYWAREKSLDKPENFNIARIDLGIGYIMTAVFNVSVLIIAAATCGTMMIKGRAGILLLAENLSKAIGPVGYWVFIVGFWGAIFSSLISFFQAIPYLFCDIIATIKGYVGEKRKRFVNMANPWFWSYSLFLALISMFMLQFKRPILFVMTFSVLGGVFMIFLSVILLYLNNQKEILGRFKNGIVINILLSLNLLLFFILLIGKIQKLLS